MVHSKNSHQKFISVCSRSTVCAHACISCVCVGMRVSMSVWVCVLFFHQTFCTLWWSSLRLWLMFQCPSLSSRFCGFGLKVCPTLQCPSQCVLAFPLFHSLHFFMVWALGGCLSCVLAVFHSLHTFKVQSWDGGQWVGGWGGTSCATSVFPARLHGLGLG